MEKTFQHLMRAAALDKDPQQKLGYAFFLFLLETYCQGNNAELRIAGEDLGIVSQVATFIEDAQDWADKIL